MSSVTPNMGLTKWDSPTDPWSHTVLANNWVLLDTHTHEVGKGPRVITEGIQSGAITKVKLGTDSVGALTDYERAYTLWKTHFAGGGKLLQSVAGVYWYLSQATAEVELSSTANAAFYWDPTEYTAGSRTIKWRFRYCLFTNSINTATNWNFLFAPVTNIIGSSSSSRVVLGNAVTGSSITIANPGVDAEVVQTMAEIVAPSTAGWYAAAVYPSANQATNSAVVAQAILQVRQV